MRVDERVLVSFLFPLQFGYEQYNCKPGTCLIDVLIAGQ